jgi:hypothetical protein
MWMWITSVLVFVAFALVIRSMLRWHDPSLDDEAKQAEASLWSKRAGSGGWGS